MYTKILPHLKHEHLQTNRTNDRQNVYFNRAWEKPCFRWTTFHDDGLIVDPSTNYYQAKEKLARSSINNFLQTNYRKHRKDKANILQEWNPTITTKRLPEDVINYNIKSFL